MVTIHEGEAFVLNHKQAETRKNLKEGTWWELNYLPISIVIIFLSNPHNTSLLINIHTISFFQKMAERSDNPLTLHRL